MDPVNPFQSAISTATATPVRALTPRRHPSRCTKGVKGVHLAHAVPPSVRQDEGWRSSRSATATSNAAAAAAPVFR